MSKFTEIRVDRIVNRMNDILQTYEECLSYIKEQFICGELPANKTRKLVSEYNIRFTRLCGRYNKIRDRYDSEFMVDDLVTSKVYDLLNYFM